MKLAGNKNWQLAKCARPTNEKIGRGRVEELLSSGDSASISQGSREAIQTIECIRVNIPSYRRARFRKTCRKTTPIDYDPRNFVVGSNKSTHEESRSVDALEVPCDG